MRTYITPDFSNVTQVMIDDCIQTSFDTLRHTATGTDLVVMKYEGADPSWVATLELTKYTKPEIKVILAKTEWNGSDD